MEVILRRSNNNNYKRDYNNFSTNKAGLTVEVRNGDFTKALRIFKKKVQEAGIIQEVREREYYEKPCEKRNRKKKAAINRHKKNLAKRKNDLGF